MAHSCCPHMFFGVILCGSFIVVHICFWGDFCGSFMLSTYVFGGDFCGSFIVVHLFLGVFIIHSFFYFINVFKNYNFNGKKSLYNNTFFFLFLFLSEKILLSHTMKKDRKNYG